MTLPQTEPQPDDPQHLPPARRRRARRLLAPLNADEKADFQNTLAHRVFPSVDVYIFSLLAGIVLGLGLFFDSPGLLFLGILISPVLTPVIGMALGVTTGNVRFFFNNLVGLLLCSLLIFGAGLLAGAIYFTRQPSELIYIQQYAQLSWANFIVLAVGAILTTFALVHATSYEEARLRAAIPSAALSYGLFVPLVTAGFGLGSGLSHLAPDGLVIFIFHLAWSILLSAIVLAVLGFRPLSVFGYTLGGVVALLGIVMIIGLSGAGAILGAQIGLPTPIPPTATPTLTPTLTSTPTHTPLPPTLTPTPTPTLTPTITPTVTPSPTPTPFFLVVFTGTDQGAVLREEPEGKVINFLAEGEIVQVFPEQIDQNGVIWLRIQKADGAQGWVRASLLVVPTPTPEP